MPGTIELLQTIGSSAGGGFIGVLIAWLGIKARLDAMQKIVENLVNEKECRARTGALSQRIDNAADRFNRIDANIEIIRQLLVDTVKSGKTVG